MIEETYRNAYEADERLPKPRLGEVWMYARQSDRNKGKESRDRGEAVTKSVGDQLKSCRRLAERYDLPINEECKFTDNKSGKLWWSGVNLGIGEAGPGTDHRPAVSALRDAILDGRCKAIVTYSQCRMFRGAAMADAFMDLARLHGVRIYDTVSGLLDIWSHDGRGYIRYRANDDQRMREKSGSEALRGQVENFEKGELCSVVGRMGFRSMGRASKGVEVVSHEIEWVRWIFKAYAHGVDERGPLSLSALARELKTNPNFQWAPDLIARRGTRVKSKSDDILPQSLRALIKDVAYRGQQKKFRRIGDCAAFLVDGAPVVDEVTWKEAQRRLASRAGRPSAKNIDRTPFRGSSDARGVVSPSRRPSATKRPRHAPTGGCTGGTRLTACTGASTT